MSRESAANQKRSAVEEESSIKFAQPAALAEQDRVLLPTRSISVDGWPLPGSGTAFVWVLDRQVK
jgi:hypothetical protein